MDEWEIKAFKFAQKYHTGQKDKAGRDYFLEHITHVVNVLKTCIADYPIEDERLLITACYLHDTIEDTTTDYNNISVHFSKRVADLVMEVTSLDDEPRNCFPRLKTLDGYLIKYADRLSNLSKRQGMSKEHKAGYMSRSIFWRVK